MNFSSEQVDQITKHVLRELMSRGLVANRTNAPEAGMPATDVGLITGVVTHDALQLANATGTIRLATDAIVTPSGHEYIRKHGLHVQRATEATSVTSSSVIGQIVWSVPAAAFTAASRRLNWKDTEVGDDASAIEGVQSDFQRHVCCVEYPSLVACELNRNPKMRAAVVTTQTNIDGLMAAMKPNVICLNPSGWPFQMARRILLALSDCESR